MPPLLEETTIYSFQPFLYLQMGYTGFFTIKVTYTAIFKPYYDDCLCIIDGYWTSQIIDDTLYMEKPEYSNATHEEKRLRRKGTVLSEEKYFTQYLAGSLALYFGSCIDTSETWYPLFEKALAKAHGDYASLRNGLVG